MSEPEKEIILGSIEAVLTEMGKHPETAYSTSNMLQRVLSTCGVYGVWWHIDDVRQMYEDHYQYDNNPTNVPDIPDDALHDILRRAIANSDDEYGLTTEDIQNVMIEVVKERNLLPSEEE